MMSETKFTKGEWRVEQFINGSGFEIAFNDDGEVVADCVNNESDANLIAVAPEMYEMLASIKTLIEWGYSASEAMEEMQKITSEITNLLAKARGEK